MSGFRKTGLIFGFFLMSLPAQAQQPERPTFRASMSAGTVASPKTQFASTSSRVPETRTIRDVSNSI